MCSLFGYKSLPYVLGLISIIEMILDILRITICFITKPLYPTNLFLIKPYNESQLIAPPLLSSTQAKAAFAIDVYHLLGVVFPIKQDLRFVFRFVSVF
jgi:hypothetical protein